MFKEFEELDNSIDIDILKAEWAALISDNGNAIAKIYSGSNALKAHSALDQKSNFQDTQKDSFYSFKSKFTGWVNDAANSAQRMYSSTFLDEDRQQLIDIFII